MVIALESSKKILRKAICIVFGAKKCPYIHHRPVSCLKLFPEFVIANIANLRDEKLHIPLEQNNFFIVLSAELSSLLWHSQSASRLIIAKCRYQHAVRCLSHTTLTSNNQSKWGFIGNAYSPSNCCSLARPWPPAPYCQCSVQCGPGQYRAICRSEPSPDGCIEDDGRPADLLSKKWQVRCHCINRAERFWI